MNKEDNSKRKEIQNRVVGWQMTPEEIKSFFDSLNKEVITFVGYSSGYEKAAKMVAIVKNVLSAYSPERTIVNIGATMGGIGDVYPMVKEMGFTTTGIVSYLAIEYIEYVSTAVDHICFVKDDLWGGQIPEKNELSPTSQAIVACSDVMIGIGGNEIGRDELIAGKEAGKPVEFYPAEVSHEYWINRAKKQGLPPPESFWGVAHEAFVNEG